LSWKPTQSNPRWEESKLGENGKEEEGKEIILIVSSPGASSLLKVKTSTHPVKIKEAGKSG
jgi:hypothetical protein